MKEINPDNLSEKEKRIVDYIIKNESSIPYMSITEVSKQLNTSVATISRLWKKIGYKNFKDFKAHAIDELNITPAGKVKAAINKVDATNLIDTVFSLHMNNIKKTLEHISKTSFNKAVHKILEAKSVYVYGPGPSSGLARVLKHGLNRYGLDIKLMDKGGSELFEDLINVDKNDVVMVFGFSKKLVETHVILDYGKKVGYETIVFTDLLISDMNDMADISLYTCRGGIREFHFMASPMILIDCLIAAITIKMESNALSKLDNISEIRAMYSHYIKG